MSGTAGEPSVIELERLYDSAFQSPGPADGSHVNGLRAVWRAAAAGAAPADGPQPKLICPECYAEKPCAKCVALGAAPASPAVREAAAPWLADLLKLAHRRDLPPDVQDKIERDVDALRAALAAEEGK
jgi:hypothetical protein